MTFNYCQKQFQDISITTAMENVSHVYIYFLPDCFLPINTINGAKFLKIQHFSFLMFSIYTDIALVFSIKIN